MTEIPAKHRSFVADADDAGRRLDRCVERRLHEFSRSRVQSLIKGGHVLVNGRGAKPHTTVREGMAVEVAVPPVEPTALVAEDIPLDVLYEDGHILVINKEAGMVVHPAAGHASGTLVNAVLHHCPDLQGIGGELRPGIVHRLDKDTSGAMVVAKNEVAMNHLVRQFKDGLVHKEYLAVVHGVPRVVSGTIETLIGRSRHDRKRMSVHTDQGRNAVSHYEVVEVFPDCCLVRVRIETGRTHQIRVHMAHFGHPVVGDTQYGRRTRAPDGGHRPGRQMLHAAFLAFAHPRTNRRRQFRAPLPDDMKTLIGTLRSDGSGG